MAIPRAEELAGISINLRFPGQYYDAETNLHYNWNRYYDPALGRYITSDSIGLDGGMNTYIYVEGNPVVYYDPKGLKKTIFLGQNPGDVPDDDPEKPDPKFPNDKNSLLCSLIM